MKIIREFNYRDMKHIQYDCNDAILLKRRFDLIKEETIDKLCEYLKKENKVIDAIDCYDSQSGWSGCDFKIGSANLSINGYCLRTENIELFLSGKHDNKFYNMWDKEYVKNTILQ